MTKPKKYSNSPDSSSNEALSARIDKQEQTISRMEDILIKLSEQFSSLNTRAGSNPSSSPAPTPIPDIINNNTTTTTVSESRDEPFTPTPAISKERPHSSARDLRMEDLRDPFLVDSIMGKGKIAAELGKNCESEDEEDKLGSVARLLSKELKSLGKSSKKHKLKEAGSFAEWERIFMKRIHVLEDMDSIKRYLLFVKTINNINRYKSWHVARAYAWIWLKKDGIAAKKHEKGEFSAPPSADEIVQDFFMRAEMKASKFSKEDKTAGSASRKKGCFACGVVGHIAKVCLVPCSNCGGTGHHSSRCFRAQNPQGSVPFKVQAQPGQSFPMGGPALLPASAPLLPTPTVCGKCGRQGHPSAQCNTR